MRCFRSSLVWRRSPFRIRRHSRRRSWIPSPCVPTPPGARTARCSRSGYASPAGLTGIVRYNFAVTFDSSVIEIMNAEEGPLPRVVSRQHVFLLVQRRGEDRLRPCQRRRVGGTMDGPGELVTLTFKAKSHGVVKDDGRRHRAAAIFATPRTRQSTTRRGTVFVTVDTGPGGRSVPDSTWRAEGEVFSIGICFSAGVKGVMGYNIAVTFDSSVIEIMNVEEGPLPQSASDTTFFWWYNAGVKTDSRPRQRRRTRCDDGRSGGAGHPHFQGEDCRAR